MNLLVPCTGNLGKAKCLFSHTVAEVSIFFPWPLNSLNPDPTQRLSIWTLVIGGAFGLFPLWAVNQTAVQRFLAAKSNKQANM